VTRYAEARGRREEAASAIAPEDRTSPRPTPDHRRPVGLPALLSVSQAARLLGVGRSTLYNGVRSGVSDVQVVRVGKQWRVPRVAVERLLDGRQPSAFAPAPDDRPP
jgi:excisionase family DNA binding protein